MLTTFLQERKKFVLPWHDDLGQIPIGQLVDAVVNSRTGKIAAWWIYSLSGLRLALPPDIMAWDKKGIHLESENVLKKPEDLPRLQTVLDQEVPIIKNTVISDGKCVGRVKDFTFDTLSPRILNLRVSSGWWWFAPRRIIPASHIQKITEQGILVDKMAVSKKINLPEGS